MTTMPAAEFTSEKVRLNCERLVAAIAATERGPLRLDTLLREIMEPRGETAPPVIRMSPPRYRRNRFTVYRDSHVLGRFKTIAAALLRYPRATVATKVVRGEEERAA